MSPYIQLHIREWHTGWGKCLTNWHYIVTSWNEKLSTSLSLCEECCYMYLLSDLQYIPRNMHTVFALLCFVVVIHWLIFPYPSGLLHWHCGNLTIATVPAKQPWWIWINTSCEFIMNDCITTTEQSTTKPCFLVYTVPATSCLFRSNMAISAKLWWLLGCQLR